MFIRVDAYSISVIHFKTVGQ